LLRLIFKHLGNGALDRDYATRNFAILVPISKTLQPFQRINLYKNVHVKDLKSLLLLAFQILKTGDGRLVKAMAFGSSIVFAHADGALFKAVVDQVAPLLTSLEKLELTQDDFSTLTPTNNFLSNIHHFQMLRHLDLAFNDPTHLDDLLSLQHLNEVHLQLVAPLVITLPTSRGSMNYNRLAVDILEVTLLDDEDFPPDLLAFIGMVDAQSYAFDSPRDLFSAVACINNSPIQLTLFGGSGHVAGVPQLMDTQLNRFTSLHHLILGGEDLIASDTFFNNVFTNLTRLSKLTIGYDFNIDVPHFVDTLRPSTLAQSLREIIMHNTDTEWVTQWADVEEDWEVWPDGCKIEDVARLIQITKVRGIKLSGSTLEAYEIALQTSQ
jgi:hypothetical protein